MLLASELLEDVPRSDALPEDVPLDAELCSDVLFFVDVRCPDSSLDDVLLDDPLFDDSLLDDALRTFLLPDADVLRSPLISAAVSERIFSSIDAIGMSIVSSDTLRVLPVPSNALPHSWQNLVPTRSTVPQSGHLFSFIALAPHFGQN